MIQTDKSYAAEPNIEMSDPQLNKIVEDQIYAKLVESLNDDQLFVENVSSVYLSKEYIEELDYNSLENIYFGYKLSDIEKQFAGEKYIFTLGANGKTIVKRVEAYENQLNRLVKNVLIGSGAILVCVTVSAVSGGLGAPAISMIFAASAKTGAIMAISGGTLGGISAGIVKGIQTGDMNQALSSALDGASEGFKWGAISGTIVGGGKAFIGLRGATLNGLSMKEAALIQKESGYPLDVIKGYRSMEQYEICKGAGLSTQIIDGKMALVRDIDLKYVDEFGKTNLQRMKDGLAALDPTTGEAYQLHHIGQKMDSTLAILTEAEHMKGGNNLIWHELGSESQINRTVFDKTRKAFWKDLAAKLETGLGGE